MLQELVQSIAVLQDCGLIIVEILGGWKNLRSRPDLVSHFDCYVAQSTCFTLHAGDFPIQSINEAFDILSNMTPIQKVPNEFVGILATVARLQILSGISGVHGSTVFSQLCIYMTLVPAQ
jgi:hypothetical protein